MRPAILPPSRLIFLLLPGLLVPAFTLLHADAPGLSNPGPLSPREEQATFKVAPGFRVELAASEPEVVDPVAMAFDEDGRLYVAEMIGYPNAGVGTGVITSGRIKRLEDRNGDGVFEHSTLFAEGLRFPTAVMPYRGGLLVANAPDLLFLRDTTGDGKADERRTLYTGFALANIQQLLNSLQWGLDNWVHGIAGGNGGSITSAEKPDMPAVELRGRGIRFRPDEPGSLQATSGGGQYGLAADDFGRWFTATNSQHLRHIVLPDEYLRRNPYLAVGAVTLDIPDHGPACKVFRQSPFEAWRVERTTRRKGGPDAGRFASTELVPGGFITSACSPVVYTADLFPAAYRGNVFVCDPANNLIHRDILEPNGATFTARRGDIDCEFLASTDNWFRPVWLTIGPEGGIYVLDFYREAIETPLSLPEDIKQQLNLNSRGRGRIWRIIPAAGAKDRPAGFTPLGKAATADLVGHLANPNSWYRRTAQRLLVERQDRAAIPALEKLVRTAASAPARAHALWTLDGLKALDLQVIAAALTDSDPGVREQAVRLCEGRPGVLRVVPELAADPSPRVRFQVALTLGGLDSPDAVKALAHLARLADTDSWTQTALLSSAVSSAPALLQTLSPDLATVPAPFLTRLAALVGTRATDAELAQALGLLAGTDREPAAWQAALLDGLVQGLTSKRSLAELWENPPAELRAGVARARPFFDRAAQLARDDRADPAARTTAVRLLGFGPAGVAGPALQALLAPQTPAEIQLAAVRSLARQTGPKVPDQLLEGWNSYSPSLRREVLEALFARKDRLTALLDAVERKDVLASQLEPARLDQLRKHADPALRQRALKLLAGQATPDRVKVIEEYRAALELQADVGRGKAVFKRVCAACHRLDDVGVEVGANLLAALPNKTPEALLIDVLDPSKEVDPRYINYVVTTRAGRSFSGMMAADTASSLTLRRAEKAEDVILRADVEEVQATAKSIMPENLETQLSRQDLADVIAYLRSAAGAK